MNRQQRRAAKSKGVLPPDVQALFDHGVQHHQAGRLAEAEQLYRQVLAVDPRHADSLHSLGVLARQVGRFDIAVDLIGQAIAVQGNNPAYYYNLGNAFRDQGKTDEAVNSYKRALALKPDLIEAHNNLGNIFQSQGRLDDAAAHFMRVIVLRPDYADAHFNLGNILRDQGRLDDAVASFQRAVALRSDADVHINLGGILQDQGKINDAIAHYESALALKPNSVEALNNVATMFAEQGKLDNAVAYHERALALKPDSAETFSNLGTVLLRQGKCDEAIACFRRGLILEPDSGVFYSNLLFAMLHSDFVSSQELAATAREFGGRLADPLRRQRPLIRNRDPDRKLRIGYVSPDFRNHPVNYSFEPLLRQHDRQQFEIFAYYNWLREDAVTGRLKQHFDHWRDIHFQNDDQVADLIEADQIDILVDLASHTSDNRLLVFARKPAPVQVTWLGFPATTGMEAMDYRITDDYAEPVGLTEHLNTEKLWRLPEIFCCYQARENSPDVIDHPPFEDSGYITFGCFNNFSKVTDPVLETWARIVARVPGSRLLLEIAGLEGPQFRTEIETRLQHCGLPLDRIILEPRKGSNQFVLYNRIDIALDPFPRVGGTTSLDTLWMGVPFITLAGEHFVSRMGVTILTNAGLPELIARNTDEYVDLAVNLALDKNRLRGLRHNLRDRVAASPLMNQQAFARNMEAAYREMWKKWCLLHDNSNQSQAASSN